MGEIRNETSQRSFQLISRFLIGRGAAADLTLSDVNVSGEHASMYFDSEHWVVRDLMSRNGTTVNGVVLKPGERRPVTEGDVIGFGGGAETWLLVDDSPPPSEAIEQTVQATFDLSEAELAFELSQDEETVTLTVVASGARIEAPSRAFHLLLLALARVLVTDQQAGVFPAEAGFVYTEELISTLYPDAETLNVNIYRARRQMEELGAREARVLVERRVSSKQIRLGVSRVTIARVGVA